jgi:hypothetical protein
VGGGGGNDGALEGIAAEDEGAGFLEVAEVGGGSVFCGGEDEAAQPVADEVEFAGGVIG